VQGHSARPGAGTTPRQVLLHFNAGWDSMPPGACQNPAIGSLLGCTIGRTVVIGWVYFVIGSLEEGLFRFWRFRKSFPNDPPLRGKVGRQIARRTTRRVGKKGARPNDSPKRTRKRIGRSSRSGNSSKPQPYS
jgi:hypothetical protein